ncbi:MAG: hypothetical protein KJO07_03360, partial [Deltaproteobacteria bacterium]|nr:hypothetical protein [Deltaproteobacteria bacterium]
TPAIQRRMYQWDLYLDSDDEKGWDSAEEKTEEWSKEVSISPKGLLTIKDEQGKTKTQQLVFP